MTVEPLLDVVGDAGVNAPELPDELLLRNVCFRRAGRRVRHMHRAHCDEGIVRAHEVVRGRAVLAAHPPRDAGGQLLRLTSCCVSLIPQALQAFEKVDRIRDAELEIAQAAVLLKDLCLEIGEGLGVAFTDEAETAA